MSANISCCCCEQPENMNQKIWRYLPFDKFIWFLEMRKLYFCRTDKLGDPFEGKVHKQVVDRYVEGSRGFVPKDSVDMSYLKHYTGKAFIIQKLSTYVNCWNLSDKESLALWKLYGKDKNSICVQSVYSTLCELLDSDVCIGIVKYENVSESEMIAENMISYIMRKRKSFIFENEVRAFIRRYDQIEQQVIEQDKQMSDLEIDKQYEIEKMKLPEGESRAIDINKLIQNIYVNPECDNWFYQLIQEISVKKYGFRNDNIKKSELDIRNTELY